MGVESTGPADVSDVDFWFHQLRAGRFLARFRRTRKGNTAAV